MWSDERSCYTVFRSKNWWITLQGVSPTTARNLLVKFSNSSRPNRLRRRRNVPGATYNLARKPGQGSISSRPGSEGIKRGIRKRYPICYAPPGRPNGLAEEIPPGAEGLLNLSLAHLLNILPIDSHETKMHIDTLLEAITSSKGDFSSQYRL